MKKNVCYILSMFIAIFFSSCTKQDRENIIIGQEAEIDKYLSSLQGAEIIRNGGSNRAVINFGDGSQAASGDSLYIRYAGYTFYNGKGSLFVTNDSTVAQKNGFPMQSAPEKIKLGKTELVKGLELGLDGVKQGEYCYIIFSAKYGYNNTAVSNIPKLTPLFYEVWVDKVIK